MSSRTERPISSHKLSLFIDYLSTICWRFNDLIYFAVVFEGFAWIMNTKICHPPLNQVEVSKQVFIPQCFDGLLFYWFCLVFQSFRMDHECYEFSSAPESGRGKQKHCNMLPDQNMRKIHHTVGEPEFSVTTSVKKSFVHLMFVRPTFL